MDITSLVCSSIKCYQRVVAKGLCDTHYRAELRKARPLYATWSNMKQRCYNPNHPGYAESGAKGIRVCGKWLDDYAAFALDMGARPLGMALERRDDEGDYTPENCLWVLSGSQAVKPHHRATNTSGTTGVAWSKRNKKWQAQITIDRRRVHLGYFDEKRDAAYARAVAEARYTI